MSDPVPNEPPPLPPVNEPPPLVGLAADVTTTAPELAPAPMLWRILAYLCDWLVVTLAFLAFLKWSVAENFAEGWASFNMWIDSIWHEYAALATHPSSNVSLLQERINHLMTKAQTIPEPAKEFLTFVTTVQLGFFWAYFFVAEYFTKGASLGKKIFNLRVANTLNLCEPGFFDSLLRAGWKALFFCSSNLFFIIIGIVDAHVPLFNRARRSIHDLLTHTIVLDASQSPLELIKSGGKKEKSERDPYSRDADDF